MVFDFLHLAPMIRRPFLHHSEGNMNEREEKRKKNDEESENPNGTELKNNFRSNCNVDDAMPHCFAHTAHNRHTWAIYEDDAMWCMTSHDFLPCRLSTSTSCGKIRSVVVDVASKLKRLSFCNSKRPLSGACGYSSNITLLPCNLTKPMTKNDHTPSAKSTFNIDFEFGMLYFEIPFSVLLFSLFLSLRRVMWRWQMAKSENRKTKMN